MNARAAAVMAAVEAYGAARSARLAARCCRATMCSIRPTSVQLALERPRAVERERLDAQRPASPLEVRAALRPRP